MIDRSDQTIFMSPYIIHPMIILLLSLFHSLVLPQIKFENDKQGIGEDFQKWSLFDPRFFLYF
jgi:hypothetical protein